MKKNAFIQMIPLLCLQAFIHLRIRQKKFMVFDLQIEEESDFLHLL